jgi:uncharacterized membrane protein
MVRKIWMYVMGLGYIVAGVNHFWHPDGYIKLVEAFLPYPLAMIYISGAAELAGGLGLMIPATRRAAAWGLILLLLAIFPANVYQAIHHEQWPDTPVWLLWARLPIQPILIFLAYLYTDKDKDLER